MVNSKEVIWNPTYSSKIAYQDPDCEKLLSSFHKNIQSWNGIWFPQTNTKDKRKKNKQFWEPDRKLTK